MVNSNKEQKRIGRIMALLLVAAICFSFTACGSSGSDVEEEDETVEEDSVYDETEEEEASEDETNDITEEESDAQGDASVETVELDQVFVETDELTVTAVSIGWDDDEKIILAVELENSSEDTNFAIRSYSQFLDGFEYCGFMYTLVCAGESEVYQIELDSSYEYPDVNLESVTEIGIELTALESMSEIVEAAGNFYIYPSGEETPVSYERVSQSTDQVLLDNDYVTITYVDCKYSCLGEGYYGYFFAYFYVENKTDNDLALSMVDGLINNSDEDFGTGLTRWEYSICAGKCKYICMKAECQPVLGYTDLADFTQFGFELSARYYSEDRLDQGDTLFTEIFDIAL